jgi:hypothetical protein
MTPASEIAALAQEGLILQSPMNAEIQFISLKAMLIPLS